jgi:hypothetical protein
MDEGGVDVLELDERAATLAESARRLASRRRAEMQLVSHNGIMVLRKIA